MQKLFFLAAFGLLMAASAPLSQASAAPSNPDSRPAPTSKTFVLSGEIDYYPIVMYLDVAENSLVGQYFYTKKGKMISLKGSKEASSDTWRIEESVNKTVTGYFSVQIADESVIGQWSAKPDMSGALQVNLHKIGVPYEPNAAIGQKINGKYVSKHTTVVYEGDDENGNAIEKEYEVTDEMAVRYIGGGYFSFWISVVGGNAHTGEVSGIAKMTSDTHAKTEMEDCDLGFDFSKANNVDIDEVDCGMYHGARAYFGVSMQKK